MGRSFKAFKQRKSLKHIKNLKQKDFKQRGGEEEEEEKVDISLQAKVPNELLDQKEDKSLNDSSISYQSHIHSSKNNDDSSIISIPALYKKEYNAEMIDNNTYTVDNDRIKVTRDGTGPYKVVFLSIV